MVPETSSTERNTNITTQGGAPPPPPPQVFPEPPNTLSHSPFLHTLPKLPPRSDFVASSLQGEQFPPQCPQPMAMAIPSSSSNSGTTFLHSPQPTTRVHSPPNPFQLLLQHDGTSEGTISLLYQGFGMKPKCGF